MKRLARFGYATEGALYTLIGLLAAGAAFGIGGRAIGQRGALELVAGGPFGGALLGSIAAGFLGYALWQSVQALADPDGEGTDLGGALPSHTHGQGAVAFASARKFG